MNVVVDVVVVVVVVLLHCGKRMDERTIGEWR